MRTSSSSKSRCVLTVLTITIWFYLGQTESPELAKLSQKPCISWRTCKECITAGPHCAWCAQPDYVNYYSRCDDENTLLLRNCSKRDIISPQTTIRKPKDRPLSSNKMDMKPAIQLKPQKLALEIRPNQEVKFNVSFKQAKNYPVDLYYLMDLTRSMNDDKEILASLAQKLVETMRDITTNFRLGFGSFVDKVVMPYVDTTPIKLQNPCPDNTTCEPPYGFKNHLSLNNDTILFTDKVRKARTSANLDDAEGGFDALMQVAVCTNEISWDPRSRKIIVFATDSGFHYAGDGKLGGIVKPNDEKCHLDREGTYTQSKFQDYPSLSQINRIVRDEKINLIFAVSKEVQPVYEKLSDVIEGASASELERDSSNIVGLIKDQYDKIRSEVILTDDSPPYISIQYRSKCKGDEWQNTTKCSSLSVGDKVDFEVTLKLEKCPESRKQWGHTIHINPVGLNEVLEIDLKMYCECECEHPKVQIYNSSKCSDIGTYQCGICKCPEGHFGRACDCDNIHSEKNNHWGNCRHGNSTTICSNRGDCICGDCHCHEPPGAHLGYRVYGTRCECDNFSCGRDANENFCGGPSRGICDCGKCNCTKDWEGATCECTTKQDTCRQAEGKELCSGSGKCVCGTCECNTTTDGQYSGPYCEDCPKCKGKCADFRPCVECKAFGQGQLSQEECKNCTFFSQEVVPFFSDTTNTELKCTFVDDNDCSFVFTYEFDKHRTAKVTVLEKKVCPQQVNAVAMGVGITAGIIVIGLLIIFAWRLCFYIKDRKAYAKFLEEKKKEIWRDDNPIYKQAKINYANPIYGQNN